ncbi:MAG: molybdenum cofactor guanylyltransferase MobA [Sneathiella sp.]|uniref:molybdenum cofactor guanylyltransferase MobA n=1 Tax=Sneathiella sp. TaxID=1964365 RepID=UPI000C5F570B|nr:molybdenum cofactor guanylyltransferase MobA [Sneathiella sp.]MAZ02636.1 molybdenum cofactor guanylyltransferase MobA [Sneathiella sp.]
MNEVITKFPCLLLAGGQSRRMGGGSKFLQELGGQTLLERIVETLRPQVGEIVLNMNADIPRDALPDLPVLKDSVSGFAGPLAGILTGLEHFSVKDGTASHMLSVPTDAPFIPGNLVERLSEGLQGDKTTIVMAYSVGRVHPVVALWPIALAADLRKALTEENMRKILVFADRYNRVEIEWTEDEGDPFFNVNRPEDLEAARQRLL